MFHTAYPTEQVAGGGALTSGQAAIHFRLLSPLHWLEQCCGESRLLITRPRRWSWIQRRQEVQKRNEVRIWKEQK